MATIKEHDILSNVPNDRYNHLSLVSWDKPTDGQPWGYYASFKIGAEWIDDHEPLIVTTKHGMEDVDFLRMFMSCFSSNLAMEELSKIYTIDFDQPTIEAPALRSVVSPLIVFHFISVVNRIKMLKKDYVHHSENLKKVKGHIQMMRNERMNIATKRYDRIYCKYDEYSEDIPENRLIKKALLFSQKLLSEMGVGNTSCSAMRLILSRCLTLFERVGEEVQIRDVGNIKGHKLFKEYAEAIRLAKVVLRHFDYNIQNVSPENSKVVPFTLDMSLLYEHYVYGLLYQAYQNKVSYQFKGVTGFPDFIYSSCGTDGAILDTKYIPKYEDKKLDTYVIRQLCGYARDLKILKKIGYEDINEESDIPNVPCIIIYPEEGEDVTNPFMGKQLKDLYGKPEREIMHFYKISVPLPTLM